MTSTTLPRPLAPATPPPTPAPAAGGVADPAADPRWARPAWVVLLLATAALYLWDLGASGWANSFYAAAAQAGSESWKAFFFGSSDAANAITVDKTPLSLWPMSLAIRVFGLNSWSLLVPQALMGVGTVALLHHTVRRTTGSAGAALLAGSVLALTPVAVLMFRFDNPDAMLALLLVGASTATLRAVEATETEGGRPVRWLVLAGALVGLGFLAKMLQAFLVLPVLALVYLLLARRSWRTRVGHLLVAFASMLVAGGWWVAIVSLWPASSRPYIGGSQTNSILELTLGYNGLGRLSGEETGSVGGGMGWGQTGLWRMFGSDLGGQVAWLLPAALLLGVAALWTARRDARLRAGLLLWTLSLLVTTLTFSFMAGIFHPYYTVALAPAIGALVGIGGLVLWRRRASLGAAVVLAGVTLVTAFLAWVLLGRSADFLPWLRWVVLGAGLVATLGLLALAWLPRRLAAAAVGLALLSGLAGPAAYAVETAGTPHTGSIPSAGPTVAGARGGPGGMPGGGPGGMPGGMPGGTPGGTPGGMTGGTPPTGAGGPGGAGGAGGLLEGTTSPAAVTALLQQDAGSYRWAAATVGSNNASGYQLASEEPVLAVGGFNGSDPSPTLEEFQAYVAAGDVHWFIAGGTGGGRGGPGGGSGTSSAIASWVEENFTATTVSGVTMYDLSTGAVGSAS